MNGDFGKANDMDWIEIEDLEVSYHVGVPDEERAQAQRLLISLRMAHDFGLAARTDDLHTTIDYYAVSRRVLAFGEGRSWKLIEKLAAELASMVLDEFGARSATVRVKKFILPEVRWVSVETSRTREVSG
jgi:dihydroneopterin aldolase